MSNNIKESSNSKDTFQLEVNDTSKFNKPFPALALDNIFLGWVTNLKPNNFTIFKTIKDSLAFTIQPQSLQKLEESEVRIVGDYVLVRDQLCAFHQVILDFPYNQSKEVTVANLQKYTDLIEFLRNTDSIEFFWYDRNETMKDYENYLRQLDIAREQLEVKGDDTNGLEISKKLRIELEDHINEIIELYSTRIREAFLIIPVSCKSKSIADVESTILRLEEKQSQILSALIDSNIVYNNLKGEHLHWFLTNFVSNIAKY